MLRISTLVMTTFGAQLGFWSIHQLFGWWNSFVSQIDFTGGQPTEDFPGINGQVIVMTMM